MKPDLANRLLLLYPRAWRDRYGEEFLATVGQGPFHLQLVLDILSGAIDAWLSGDVRSVTRGALAPNGGGPTMLKALIACERRQSRVGVRDGLIGAGVMIGATLVLSLLGLAAKRSGWPVAGDTLLNLAFYGSFTLSTPFWLTKSRSWKVQAMILAFMFVVLLAASYIAAIP